MEDNYIKDLDLINSKYKCLFGCFVDLEKFYKQDNKEKTIILYTRDEISKNTKKGFKLFLKQLHFKNKEIKQILKDFEWRKIYEED